MLNLDEIVTVTFNDRVVFQDRVPRFIGNLARTLRERGDPGSIFSGEVVVTSEQGSVQRELE